MFYSLNALEPHFDTDKEKIFSIIAEIFKAFIYSMMVRARPCARPAARPCACHPIAAPVPVRASARALLAVTHVKRVGA